MSDTEVVPQEQGLPQHRQPFSVVDIAAEYAKKPVNTLTLGGTITLAAIAAILMAHSDFAVGAIAGLAAIALWMLCRSSSK